MLYVLSFAFQLSGGVILLLLWVFTDVEKKVKDSYHPTEAIAQPDDNGICILKKERVQEIVADIYRNRFAFGDLCVGYLIAVVAEKTLSNCETIFSVIFMTISLAGFEYCLSEILARRNFPEDVQVSSSELEELGVIMTANNRENEEMMNDIGFDNVQ